MSHNRPFLPHNFPWKCRRISHFLPHPIRSPVSNSLTWSCQVALLLPLANAWKVRLTIFFGLFYTECENCMLVRTKWLILFSGHSCLIVVNAENVQRELEMLSQDGVTNDINGNIARSTHNHSADDSEANNTSTTTSVSKNVVNNTGLPGNKI